MGIYALKATSNTKADIQPACSTKQKCDDILPQTLGTKLYSLTERYGLIETTSHQSSYQTITGTAVCSKLITGILVVGRLKH